MTARRNTLVFVGLPENGKSSFLAALWHVIDSNRDGLGCPMELQELDDECLYMNSLSKVWSTCKAVTRTRKQDEQTARMLVREKSSDREVALQFPDLSGETFREQWEKRYWTPEYVELLSAASGILLFVHPNAIRSGNRLSQCDELQHEQSASSPSRTSSEESGSEEPVKWNPAHTPTAVQLVELLQFATRKLRDPKPFPVAVIVSAWDLAIVDGVSPQEWFGKRLPFLKQYLQANAEIFASRVFGISALGGDITDPDEERRLLGLDSPSERILVAAPGKDVNDITAPIRWLVNQADSRHD